MIESKCMDAWLTYLLYPVLVKITEHEFEMFDGVYIDTLAIEKTCCFYIFSKDKLCEGWSNI
jgi:hypothetical protein